MEQLLETQGELGAFRTYQKQPAHRRRPIESQLSGFLWYRKLAYGALIVNRLDLDRISRPLAAVLNHALAAEPPIDAIEWAAPDAIYTRARSETAHCRTVEPIRVRCRPGQAVAQWPVASRARWQRRPARSSSTSRARPRGSGTGRLEAALPSTSSRRPPARRAPRVSLRRTPRGVGTR